MDLDTVVDSISSNEESELTELRVVPHPSDVILRMRRASKRGQPPRQPSPRALARTFYELSTPHREARPGHARAKPVARFARTVPQRLQQLRSLVCFGGSVYW